MNSFSWHFTAITGCPAFNKRIEAENWCTRDDNTLHVASFSSSLFFKVYSLLGRNIKTQLSRGAVMAWHLQQPKMNFSFPRNAFIIIFIFCCYFSAILKWGTWDCAFDMLQVFRADDFSKRLSFTFLEPEEWHQFWSKRMQLTKKYTCFSTN